MTTLTQTNEKCWILVGQPKGAYWECALMQPTEGNPTKVSFAHDWVLKREDEFGDVVGFLHTHPSGSLDPSETDVETMRAWASCLGRPMLCLIACEERIEAFLFRDDECDGWRLSAAEKLNQDTVIVCDRQFIKIGDAN